MGPVTSVKEKEVQDWKALKKLKRKWKKDKLIQKLERDLKRQEEAAKEKLKSRDESTKPKKIELSTISVAVPGSILDNAQCPELKALLAGQIARAICIFKVNEVIVYDDFGTSGQIDKATIDVGEGEKTGRQCCVQLARILQYLECPQYLRKHIFPLHKDLKHAGLLSPLDAPHHLRATDNFMYREGIVVNHPTNTGCYANIGLRRDAHLDIAIPPGMRVTVKLQSPKEGSKKVHGVVVSPLEPQAKAGVYWGYNIRLADCLSAVFSQCPYADGYDITIGTSDKGKKITEVKDDDIPKYKHALIVFGGLQGLEAAADNDDVITETDPSILFDYYLNTCPGQGSRTIRTEEAILISMAAMSTRLKPFIETPCNMEEFYKTTHLTPVAADGTGERSGSETLPGTNENAS